MKFTVVFITLLSIAWAVKVQNSEEPKDKREAQVGYPGGGGGGGHLSQSHGYGGGGAPAFSHEDANAISIGAGYSVGGGKPSFSYGAPEGGHFQLSSEGLPSSGHATIQLAPITLQPSHGSFASSDLSQLMSQLSHGLNSGALQLSPYQGEGGQGDHGGQEISAQQYSFGEPNLQQFNAHQQPIPSIPSYAAGTKGLGSYGSTGPVLFTPSDSNQHQPGLSYGAPSGGHSFGDGSGLTYGTGSLAALAIGDSGHSFGGSSGHNFGGHGISLAESGHSLGGPSHSLGSSGGHSFGGSIKQLSGGYAVPSKASFKPSTFLGSHSDGGHGLAGFSQSHGAPSFVAHAPSGGHSALSLGSGSHGHSFGSSLGGFGGSSKFIAPSYLPPKSKGFGGSLDSVAAYTSGSHASPPRTTYGHPTASYPGGSSTASHGASSHSPQYYVSSSKFPSFGEGSSSFKGTSGHGSLSSLSSGPKYSFGGHSGSSSRYSSPKDIQGAYSETAYNTIKYSEELKPRVH